MLKWTKVTDGVYVSGDGEYTVRYIDDWGARNSRTHWRLYQGTPLTSRERGLGDYGSLRKAKEAAHTRKETALVSLRDTSARVRSLGNDAPSEPAGKPSPPAEAASLKKTEREAAKSARFADPMPYLPFNAGFNIGDVARLGAAIFVLNLCADGQHKNLISSDLRRLAIIERDALAERLDRLRAAI